MVFDSDTLVAIYESEGRVIEIEWPASKVVPTKDQVYTVQSARHRPGKSSICVIRVGDGLHVAVQLDAAVDRPVWLRNGNGYTTDPAKKMRAFRRGSDGNGNGSLPIVSEDEPEALPKATTDEMARRTRLDRIEERRLKLNGLYERLAELKSDPDFSRNKSDLKFIESLTRKLEKDKAKDDADYLADLEEAS